MSGGSCSTERRPASALRVQRVRRVLRVLPAVLAVLAIVVLPLLQAGPAAAQGDPGATTVPGATTAPTAPPVLRPESAMLVAQALSVDGVYAASERPGIDRDQLVEQVKQARALGLRLVVVVPNNPEPTARAFARRILEGTGADAALIFPPTGGAEADVVPELTANSRAALAAASAKADPVAATQVYAQQLLAKPSRSLPAAYTRTGLLVVLLIGVLIAALMIERGVRRGAVQGRLWTTPDWMARNGPPPATSSRRGAEDPSS